MVKIIGDTTSGLPASIARRYDISIVPQVIIFGEDSYLEGVEITYDSFMTRLQAATELPKTAAPPPELFVRVFQRLAPLGEPIVCILPSALVSGTVRSAALGLEMAREQGLEGLDVRIVDTRLIASPVATLLHLAAEWAAQGVDADTIEARVREMSGRCRIYFVVDTLKYLAMGGRIGGAAALLGSVLQVKPLLTFREGQVDTLEKVRTQRRALERMKRLVVDQIAPGGRGYLSVMHAAAEERAMALVESLQAQLGLSEVPVLRVPPAVATHAGPGALGVGFFTE